MNKEFKSENTSWISIKKPSLADINFLKRNFNFHKITLEELKRPSVRTKVEINKDYLFMVIHFPIYLPKEKASYDREIDFLITQKALITVTYHNIPALEEIQDKIKKDPDFKKTILRSPAILLYRLLEANLEFSHRQLIHIKNKIDQVEKNIYHGKEREMLEDISVIMRDILDCHRIIKAQSPLLDSLEKAVLKFFGDKYKPYFESLIGKHQLVSQITDSHYETVKVLQDTNFGLLSIRINEAVRNLTGFAVPVFFLTLLSTILGWHFLPRFNTNYDGFIFIGGLILIGLIMIFTFKHKKWI